MKTRKILSIGMLVIALALLVVMFALKFFPSRTELDVDYSGRYYQLIKKDVLTEEERNYIMREESRVQSESIGAYEKQKAERKYGEHIKRDAH